MKGQLINPSGLDAPNLAPLAMEPDIIQIQSARRAIIGFGPFILLESLLEILVNGWSVRTESAFLHRREYPLNEIMLAFYKIRVILELVLLLNKFQNILSQKQINIQPNRDQCNNWPYHTKDPDVDLIVGHP